MNGKGRLNKGKSGEREVVKLLQPVIDEVYTAKLLEPPRLQRNTLQSDSGGYDIVGLAWLALEVKRCETLNLNAWWKQTERQCGKDQTPVLMYRQSRKPWRCRILAKSGEVDVLADISIEDFLIYFKDRLERELAWRQI